MEAINSERGHLTAHNEARHSALRPVLLYYAIASSGDDALRLLHVPLGYGEEALILFSSWGAAQRYFLSEVFSGEWFMRECSGGELVSMLLGPHEGTQWVLLDPLPGSPTAEGSQTELVARKRFVDHLLG